MSRWVLSLLVAALLLPSANLQVLDGLPLSHLPEAVALVLLLPLLVSRGLRRLHARQLRRWGPRAARGLLAAGALAVGAKLVLLASGAHAGFLACYRTPLGPPPGGACERSFENPLARFDATRVDRRVDFGPGTWNLTFLNSLRFNYYPWVAGHPRRDRLPLEVTWSGTVVAAQPWIARLTYVGDAMLTVGPETHELPAHYGPPRTVRLPVAAGRHALRLRYRFDDGTRTGAADPVFPAATVRLARERVTGGESPVQAAPAARVWRVGAALADVALGLTLLSLVPFYLGLLAPGGLALAAAVGAGAVAALRVLPAPPWLPSGGPLLPCLAGLAVAAAVRPRPRTLLAAYIGIVVLSGAVALQSVPALGTVLLRSAGDDWLTYESQARDILDTWSLQGGEDRFFNVPFYRYLRFAQRLLLGDGDLLALASGLAALYFAATWMVARLAAGPRATVRGRIALVLAATLVLAMTGAGAIVAFVLRPLSEPVTWAALLAAFPLLMAARTPRAWPAGATLAAVAAGTRPNQLPAIALLLAAFLIGALPRRPRRALAALALFLAIMCLPLAHNLYYGGRFVPLMTTAAVNAPLTLPPDRLLAIGRDPTVRTQAWTQIRQTLFLDPLPDLPLRLTMHGLQIAWALAIVAVVRAWRQSTASTRLLLAWPVAFLGVHLFYTPLFYFPRHLVAGYLSMGLVAGYVASGRGAADPGAP